ncbi:MAG: restriction endonuclease [Nitrospirae bacterium]|nr:restriction endonuclease [Nitrospirota bacterium]
MLQKEKIVELLESLHEHTMAKDIIVPLLRKMGLKGVKYTGGDEEQGIDIEYYELTQPENLKSYVGIQCKKGSLVYSATGAKGSVKDVKNQAEEAFDKEIYDISDRSLHYISRFIVVVTGDINEHARRVIDKARRSGKDRRIDYWDGDRLAEYIQDNYMEESESYFSSQITEEGVERDETEIIDIEYLKDNFAKKIEQSKKIKATISGFEWSILRAVIKHIDAFSSSVEMSDLLVELECTEDYIHEELLHLINLGYLDIEDYNVSLSGKASIFSELSNEITEELVDAGEDPERVDELFNALLK